MEVHHHPEVEKKGIKEYILEGLMIFIAVFMGFIAENVREHIVEKNKAKEYMQEMTHNLEFDTLRCALNTSRNLNLIKGLDSLRAEVKQALAGNVNCNRLYYFYLRYGSAHSAHAVFNTSAITELRNSGSFRLIANQKLVADMADYYDRRIPAAEGHFPTSSQDKLGDASNELFSWIYFDNLLDVAGKKDAKLQLNYNYGQLLVMKPSPKLIKTRPEDITQFYNAICNFELGIKNYDFFLSYAKGPAVALISSIKKEYNLEDE